MGGKRSKKNFCLPILMLAQYLGLSPRSCIKPSQVVGINNLLSLSGSFLRPTRSIFQMLQALPPLRNPDSILITGCTLIREPIKDLILIGTDMLTSVFFTWIRKGGESRKGEERLRDLLIKAKAKEDRGVVLETEIQILGEDEVVF